MASKAMREQARALGAVIDEGLDGDEEAPGASAFEDEVAPPSRPAPAVRSERARLAQNQAPQPAVVAEDAEWDEAAIEEQETEILLPIIPKGRAIYLGNSRKMSLSLRGKVWIEEWELEPPVFQTDADGKPVLVDGKPVILRPAVKQRNATATEEDGIQCYDFSSHDSRGRVDLRRMMPATLKDPVVRGKPYSVVEHAEHLRFFLRKRDIRGEREFKVLVLGPYRKQFLDYVNERERAMGRKQALIEATAKEGA